MTAFVEFVPCDPIDGKRCFNIGYAVPKHTETKDGQRKLSERP